MAIEETRVAILRGCHEPEDVVYLDLSEEPSGKKFADTLIPIRFFVRRGGGELIKPGMVDQCICWYFYDDKVVVYMHM